MSRLRAHHICLTMAIAMGVGGVVMWSCRGHSISHCEHEVRYGDKKRGVQICSTSFQQTGNERELAWEAKAHMYLSNFEEAERLGRRLLRGPASGDAHGILSYLAVRQADYSQARMHAVMALCAHTLTGDQAGRVSDLHMLSLAALGVGDYRAALTNAEKAIALAREQDDVRAEVMVSLPLADALRRVGDLTGATETLDRTIRRATAPCDKAWAVLKRGLCQMELGQDALAMVDFIDAAVANRSCESFDITTSVSIGEAWLLRSTDPTKALTRLDQLASSKREWVETSLLRGFIAADQGKLAEAEGHLDRASRLVPHDPDWEWEVECAKAELAVLRGGPLNDLSAELHYRRAISMIARQRRTARAQSAFFVSSHRRPFDGLIALLARRQQWRAVLSVVLELDASDMLRATGDEAVRHAAPVLEEEPEMAPGVETLAVDDVLAAWRGRDLLVVIAPSAPQIGAGTERAYRLWLTEGRVIGEDVGHATVARTQANTLFKDPDDKETAKALGQLFIPPRAAGGAFDVLAIGALGKVPLAALRGDDGSLVIRRHSLTRVLALEATGTESVGGGASLVLANPTGDLVNASREGSVVAEVLGPGVQLCGSGRSCAASRSRLWSARSVDLLHVAGHVSSRGRLRTLRLSDGDVDPLEIVKQGLAPRLAVLAGCGSAAATDEEGWGSIAAALLESGTAMVIATDRSVDDAAALAVIRRFYAQPDWRAAPAHALSQVQQAMEAEAVTSADKAASAQVWAAFSALRRPPVVVRSLR